MYCFYKWRFINMMFFDAFLKVLLKIQPMHCLWFTKINVINSRNCFQFVKIQKTCKVCLIQASSSPFHAIFFTFNVIFKQAFILRTKFSQFFKQSFSGRRPNILLEPFFETIILIHICITMHNKLSNTIMTSRTSWRFLPGTLILSLHILLVQTVFWDHLG